MSAGAVVVGVDGSVTGLVAVRWAAREAALRHRPLRMVHAQDTRPYLSPAEVDPALSEERRVRELGNQLLAHAAAEAQAVEHGLRIERAVLTERPAPALLEESRTAALCVVGSRGLGGFAGLLVGSVSLQLAAHAACPVVVVRPETRPAGGPVVVGVDGSLDSQEALGFGFEEASLRGLRLVAVHAWTPPAVTGHGEIPPPVYAPELVGEEERRLLAEALAGWTDKYPDVAVEPVVAGRPATHALLDAGRDATLLVVGCRGRGGFAGLVVGSTSQAVLHHAECPVAVVHRPRT